MDENGAWLDDRRYHCPYSFLLLSSQTTQGHIYNIRSYKQFMYL